MYVQIEMQDSELTEWKRSISYSSVERSIDGHQSDSQSANCSGPASSWHTVWNRGASIARALKLMPARGPSYDWLTRVTRARLRNKKGSKTRIHLTSLKDISMYVLCSVPDQLTFWRRTNVQVHAGCQIAGQIKYWRVVCQTLVFQQKMSSATDIQ